MEEPTKREREAEALAKAQACWGALAKGMADVANSTDPAEKKKAREAMKLAEKEVDKASRVLKALREE